MWRSREQPKDDILAKAKATFDLPLLARMSKSFIVLPEESYVMPRIFMDLTMGTMVGDSRGGCAGKK